MDIKHCHSCGKEIPQEANFCPYCMTKFIAEDETEIPISKKRRKKIYIVMILCIIMAVLGTVIFVMLKEKTKDIDYKERAILHNEDDADKEEDYSRYLGVWFDEANKNTKDITETGGKKIEICKTYEDKIIFNIESIANSYSWNKTAHLDYIELALKGGEGTFYFTDDGFGNSGSGVIKLSDGNIYARVELDSKDTGGSWDISMDTDFVRTEEYKPGQKIDVDGILTKYDTQKIKLGNRTDIQKYGDSISYVFERGITVNLEKEDNPDELYIKELWIDYDNLNSDYKYCYKGIDDTCSKANVEKILGKENIISASDYYYYVDNDRVATTLIYFDEKGIVNGIDYSSNK